MINHSVPCIYYPTTTLLVDDSHRFLKNIVLQLDPHLISKVYDTPVEALDYVKKQQHSKKNITQKIVTLDMDSDDYLPSSRKMPVSFDISKLYREAYHHQCYDEVSVVVVDYAMPTMNGAEFCYQLKGFPVKKIMLTGEADQTLAMELFNAGVIDKFILKSQPNMSTVLNESITALQLAYFQEMTAFIKNGLAIDNDSCLSDPLFANFFTELCQELSPASYYLIELSGSFLFLMKDGSPVWLLIKTQQELHELAEGMEDTQNVSEKLLEEMRNGEQIPYFHDTNTYLRMTGDQLASCLYPAKKLQGRETYSYAIVKDLSQFKLDRKRILSFVDYLNNSS